MIHRMLQWFALAVLAMPIGLLAAQPYDPLVIAKAVDVRPLDFDVQDEARNRSLPIRVYLPAASGPAPVVVFSHGLGGSREGNAFMGLHWAARGYAVVFVQHPGSDESVWKDTARLQRMAAMRKAASVENFVARVKDVSVVLDQLQKWNLLKGHPLVGKLDLSNVGMSGHSFGAITTQAMGGQTFENGRRSFADTRIKAAVMFSPSSPRRGSDSPKTFGEVSIPWLLMTGTKDVALIGDADLDSRLAVFPALPAGQKYELVLDGAEHSAFTERPLPGESGARNPNHHPAILALSTAFWDAYLKGNVAAKDWLKGDGPRSVLEPADRWQLK